MPHAPAGRGTSRFLSLRPSGCFWTQLSGAERFLPPVLGTLVSPSFRSGAAHTGLGSRGWLCWGVRGRESLLLSTLLLKLLTQALKTSTSAFSGTSPYPWPLPPILEVGHVVEVCLGGRGWLVYWTKLPRLSGPGSMGTPREPPSTNLALPLQACSP